MAEVFDIVSGHARLAAEAAGDGTPVVLLHAGVCDRRMWADQMASLARLRRGFRAVAYDRRGHGETLHADERWSQVGDLDFPSVVAACEHLCATVPDARRHVFEGAAHLPNLEQPAAFNRLLADFCGDCSARA